MSRFSKQVGVPSQRRIDGPDREFGYHLSLGRSENADADCVTNSYGHPKLRSSAVGPYTEGTFDPSRRRYTVICPR
jgi:hypothetical protein